MQSKWLIKSVTIIGLLGSLAGGVWEGLDPDTLSVAVDAAQQVLQFGGLLVAAIGRLRKGQGTPVTVLPKL